MLRIRRKFCLTPLSKPKIPKSVPKRIFKLGEIFSCPDPKQQNSKSSSDKFRSVWRLPGELEIVISLASCLKCIKLIVNHFKKIDFWKRIVNPKTLRSLGIVKTRKGKKLFFFIFFFFNRRLQREKHLDNLTSGIYYSLKNVIQTFKILSKPRVFSTEKNKKKFFFSLFLVKTFILRVYSPRSPATNIFLSFS